MLNNYDISKLPDKTFFYVVNGGWTGYVTTENGNKVLLHGCKSTTSN